MDHIDASRYLALRTGATVLEADAHGDKVLRLADGSILKLFRRKRLLSSALWSPYARRFADNARALAQRGIPCPVIIAVFRIGGIQRDAVHYQPLEGITLRELARQDNTAAVRQHRTAFSLFVRGLHEQGIYFRSLHLGNVVLTPDRHYGLIDIADLRIHRGPLSRFLRRRNLRRLQGIPGECEWLDETLILGVR